ncbi:MAG TPA: dicarboxylate/amino acid:cation symporter [Steroidobacteraceae bacterium]|nr:dicarboxylate/amino acid:cation symporter [Steroidobacteraceae bacterium]
MSERTAWLRLPLQWQILIAIAVGALVGYLVGPDAAIFSVPVVSVFDFLGTLFVNALKMLVVPLIVSSVISGVAGIGSARDLGRLGGKTLLFYIVTTLIAVLVALTVLNIVRPGIINGMPARELLALETSANQVAGAVEHGGGKLVDTFLGIVPPNVIEAAIGNKLLGLVFFSILFGFFLTRIPAEQAKPVRGFWDGMFQVMMRMTEFVMRFAPLGVFGLAARTVAKTGFGAAGPLLLFSATVLAGLLIYFVALLPLLVRLTGRTNPWPMFPAMAPALLTAFSTASSSATLAMSIDCVERRVGVSNRVTGFVMPLGASLNHAGSALYECAAAMFIAQAYGLHLSFGHQFTIVVLALITSMGIAGIPAASLVAITVILTAVGLPAEAVGVLLVFDRILDMCRTAVNVFADACCALIVARLEGESGIPKRASEWTST